jgi:hypothetical protein
MICHFPCHKYVTDSVEKRVNYGIGAERRKQGKDAKKAFDRKKLGENIMG